MCWTLSCYLIVKYVFLVIYWTKQARLKLLHVCPFETDNSITRSQVIPLHIGLLLSNQSKQRYLFTLQRPNMELLQFYCLENPVGQGPHFSRRGPTVWSNHCPQANGRIRKEDNDNCSNLPHPVSELVVTDSQLPTVPIEISGHLWVMAGLSEMLQSLMLFILCWHMNKD